MERTLEQVIMDASKSHRTPWVDFDEAAAIAEAVRGWMREQNEGLRGVIFDILLEELPPQSVSHADADSCVDAILSVIPPQEPDYRSMTWAMPEEDDAERSKRLAYRLEILERENADLRKRLPDPATLQTEMEKWQASRIKKLEDELQHLESNLMVGGKPVSTGISPAEGDDLDAMLKLQLDNQRGLTREESERLTKFMHETATGGSIDEEPFKFGEPDKFPYDIHDHLISTEPLYAWANKRIEMLEEESKKRIKEFEAKVARLKEPQSTYERQIASDEKYAKTIQEEWDALRAKAAKYNELRAKFPFLPGEEFWTLFQGSIRRWECCAVRQNILGSTECKVFGRMKRSDGALVESPLYYLRECHPTADACRAAIPVEE